MPNTPRVAFSVVLAGEAVTTSNLSELLDDDGDNDGDDDGDVGEGIGGIDGDGDGCTAGWVASSRGLSRPAGTLFHVAGALRPRRSARVPRLM
mmetsp:Transcript_92287/g.263668  ORF Transcript_92287/g.263668 Transcript_92287/m.263668 type:complete len:93 (-) Transcript_92287:132-410(-)